MDQSLFCSFVSFVSLIIHEFVRILFPKLRNYFSVNLTSPKKDLLEFSPVTVIFHMLIRRQLKGHKKAILSVDSSSHEGGPKLVGKSLFLRHTMIPSKPPRISLTFNIFINYHPI